MSEVAGAERHGHDPRAYAHDLLTHLPTRPPNADVSELLCDR
ncbi:transposase domain-containing protein [Limnoglobus roseus]|nr:transposase domain-containing protein [Limnoglobus roseus]